MSSFYVLKNGHIACYNGVNIERAVAWTERSQAVKSGDLYSVIPGRPVLPRPGWGES